MKFSNVAGKGGPDRKIRLPRQMFFGDRLAPHSVTEQGSLVVGAGKAWQIHSLFIYIQRGTAASAVGDAVAFFTIQQVGESESNMGHLFHNTSNNAAHPSFNLPVDFYLQEGDEVRFFTQDLSTGGELMFSSLMLFSEYNV